MVIKIRETVPFDEDELAIFDEGHRISRRVWRPRKELIDCRFLHRFEPRTRMFLLP
jgi:hypothetical protein